jgi:hypothetical protein
MTLASCGGEPNECGRDPGRVNRFDGALASHSGGRLGGHIPCHRHLVGEYRGATTVSHGGSWAGYRSLLLRFPEQGLSVVILGNVSDLNAGALGYRIADVYLADVLAPALEGDETPPSVAAAGEPFAPTAAELAVIPAEPLRAPVGLERVAP